MSSILGFLSFIFQLALLGALILIVVAFLGYNRLRGLAESIKESWSNIGVVGRKQASLINQLIDVVKGYQESEKLVMLKVSEDMTNVANIAQMHEQSSVVLSAVSGMAQKFPDLKANEQYAQLIQSIQQTEADLEKARQGYNQNVKAYNVRRSALPHVLYAARAGFQPAPYLEFVGQSGVSEMGSMKSFVDDDGERINAMLGSVGSTALKLGAKAVRDGKDMASMAVASGRDLVGNKQNAPATAAIEAPTGDAKVNSSSEPQKP